MIGALAWPAVHIVLVELFEVNSWKLGGWGMYADVQPIVQGEITCDVEGVPTRVIPAALARYEWSRIVAGVRNLGLLASPESSIQVIRANDQRCRGLVELRLRRTKLERRSKRFSCREVTYLCDMATCRKQLEVKSCDAIAAIEARAAQRAALRGTPAERDLHW